MVISAAQLVGTLEAAIHLDPADKAALTNSKGAAYEAFVLHAVGEKLHLNHGWVWVHPAGGSFRFPTSSGGALEDALSRYSRVESGVGWLVPTVTVRGRSGATHDLDAVLLRPGAHHGFPRWNRVRGVVECKNHTRAMGPGSARDMVGLATELRLGALYRLHATRTPAAAQFVTAGSVTANATEILEGWKIDVRNGVTPSSTNSAPSIAATLVAAL